MTKAPRQFHLHLISDATGETLIAASRAVASQYENTEAVEHVYPLVRNKARLDEVLVAIDKQPGIVLFTIADENLSEHLHSNCRSMGIPCVSVLDPIFKVFQSYLGIPAAQKSGAQHELNAEYFQRIDALNFTLMHDDGQLPDEIEETDIILLGISRTSKTPTSIYLANRGVRTTNYPIVPNVSVPRQIIEARRPLVVALLASTDRIHQVRQNRMLGDHAAAALSPYTDRASIAEELAHTRKLCNRYGWPKIDVTRKSIEETAAAILALYQQHRERVLAGSIRTGKT